LEINYGLTKNMGDNDTNRRPANSSEHENNQGEHKVRRRRIGSDGFTGALAVFGLVTGSSGHWFDWWFIALFIPAILISGGRALYEHARDKWSEDNAFVCSWILPMVAAVLIAFAYLISWPKPEPKPHFRLVLNTSSHLELTNSFLFPGASMQRTLDKNGFLIVPLTTNSDCSLLFLLASDSPVTAENVSVILLVSSNLNCSPAAGWELDNRRHDDDMLWLGFRNSFPISGFDGLTLPALQFRPRLEEGKLGSVPGIVNIGTPK
jgi:hypothetical protein